MLRTLFTIILFLLVWASFGWTLEVKLNLHDLLFVAGESATKEIIKILYMGQDLNILLQLAFCDSFDFSWFIPDDPLILKPVIESLRQKGCQKEVEERFYNFVKLQNRNDGREFLIELKANFARPDWKPSLFTIDQVKTILLQIQKYPPSQIRYLDAGGLVYVLRNDSSSSLKFLSENQLGNLIGIPGFLASKHLEKTPLPWLEQIRSQIAGDDLLFYRLAFLSQNRQWLLAELPELVENLLYEALSEAPENSPSEKFRESVLDYYLRKDDFRHQISFLRISYSILKEDPIAQATLHFEHVIATFKMKQMVPQDQIGELFKKFDPKLVSPFLCRSLSRYLDYDGLMLALNNSEPWMKLYNNTRQNFLYFSEDFLQTKSKLKLR